MSALGPSTVHVTSAAFERPVASRISQHHYSGVFCQGGNFPLVSFLSKSAVRGNLSIFNADIAATHAQGLTYILGYAVIPLPSPAQT